jgi:elongation factor 1 alpha-like protein
MGHVDAGKSTLVGHLKRLLGQIDDKLMHKYEEESKIMGKSSFKYAWIVNQTLAERERGITIHWHSTGVSLPNGILVNFLNGPGHKDYLKNMITCCFQSDFGILVVPVNEEYEYGIKG